METILNYIRALLQPPYTYLLCFALAVFVLGAVLRLAGGAAKTFPRAASACFAILFIYVVSICTMGAEGQTKVLLNALPFFGQVSDAAGIFVMMRTSFSAFLLEAAQLLILSFIINLLQDLLGKLIQPQCDSHLLRFFVWYFWQCVIVCIGLAANYGAYLLIRRYLSDRALKWILVGLLILLTAAMVLMALRLLLRSVAFFARPVFTLLSGFFFTNRIGRNLTNAFLTTAALTLIVVAADRIGWLLPLTYGGILLTSFAPVLILLLVIWYLVWILL